MELEDRVTSVQTRRDRVGELIPQVMSGWAALTNHDEAYYRDRYLEWIDDGMRPR